MDRPLVERCLTPRECPEQGKLSGSCVVGPQEPCVDEWRKNWITLHCTEEDLQKFEVAEQVTQEKMQMPCLDGKEVEQLTDDSVIFYEAVQ